MILNYFLHFVSSFIIILYCFDKVKILNDLDELVANLLKENNKKIKITREWREKSLRCNEGSEY